MPDGGCYDRRTEQYLSVLYAIGGFIIFAVLMSLFGILFQRGIAAVIIVLSTFSLITLIAIVSISLIDVCLKFLKGIAWRIVEYDKGPLAAIILIATVVLGIYLQSVKS